MKTDVAIVGGGPGGAASSMFLAQAGIDSVVVEKDEFPRYHIGESMTGEGGDIVRALGLEAEMLEFCHPIKRGVTVYGGSGKNAWFVPVMARTPEGDLVDGHTWQVRRSDFDKLLLDEARSRGATFLRAAAKEPLLGTDGEVRGLRVETADGKARDLESKVVIDASGRANFLYHAGVTGERHLGHYDKQIAIFSQIRGGIRDEGPHRDDTLIFYQEKYHWAWFIPLDEEVVSVGVVVPADYFVARKESKRDFLVRELAELNPELHRRIPEVDLVEEVRAIPNYCYQIDDYTGRGFLCVGDAHRFIDPIFSYGLFLTTQEARFAAREIERYLGSEDAGDGNPFAEYEELCERGQDVCQDVIDSFWDYPLAFALMIHERHRGDFIDMLSGRIYGEEPSPGLKAVRRLLSHGKARES